MKKIKKHISTHKLLLISILILGFIVRFAFTDRIPVAIGGDELDYVLTSKAIALSGHDITGKWSPLSLLTFHYPPQEVPKAELSYLTFIFPVGFFSLNLLSSRLISILLGFLTIPFSYLIVKKLFNKNAALAAAFVAAINPWSIYAGRTAYEMVPAAAFYFGAFALLLYAKKWNILWSIPLLFMAFLAYIGTKILLIPFLLLIILYMVFFEHKRKYLLQYGIVFAACLALVLYYAFFITHNASTSRLSEIISPSSPIFTSQVIGVRQASIQNIVTETFENKGTMFVRYMISKFFNIFSADYLFVSGDAFYSLYRHGFFYIADVVFLILGMLYSFAVKRKVFFFLTLAVLMSTVPQLIHGTRTDNFSPHLALFFPLFSLFIGIGIYYCFTIFKKRSHSYIVFLGIGAIYLVMIANFFNIYFFQNSLSGNFDFPVRVFSHYASLANSKDKILIASPRSGDLFRKYIFYADLLNKDNLSLIRNAMNNHKYVLKNVEFTSCDNGFDTAIINKIIIYDAECGTLKKDAGHIAVKRLSDQGESYRIYNDKVCNEARKNIKTAKLSVNSFALEKLSLADFCSIYFR